MRTDWILVADASRARLLQLEEGRPMVELQGFVHPASRLHSSELGDDARGREHRDGGQGAVAYSPRLEPQRKEHLRFARELADFLEGGAQQHRYAGMHLFAPSPFLGELKAALGDGTRRLLASSHDLDLSALRLPQLGERIEQALAASPAD